MDLDRALVSAVVGEGKPSLTKIKELGVTSNLLEGAGKLLFDLVDEHTKTYGDLPSAPIIEAKTGLKLDIVQEPAEFFAREVLNRALFLDLKKGAGTFSEFMEQAKPQEALDHLETLLREMRQVHGARQSRVESLPKLFKDVAEYYDKIKSGARGIETPWPTVNDETLGFWPEDLAMFVARVGIGKCVHEDTELVDPVTGVPLRIKDIYEDADFSRVVSWSRASGVQAAAVSAKVDTGRKRCLRFVLRSGREVTVTPEHPFLTPDGWVRADELEPGDSVGTPARMPAPEKPESLSTAELDLLAVVLAEGSTTGNHTGFSTSDPEILRRCQQAALSFDCGVTHRGAYDYDFVRQETQGSNGVKQYLSARGCYGVLAKEKLAPQAVFRLAPDQLSHFLGVFWMCDGEVNQKTGPSVTLASKRLVFQIQSLLLRLGVQSTVRERVARAGGKTFPAWRLRVLSQSLSAFAQLPLWGEKQRRVQSLLEKRNPNRGSPKLSDATMQKLKVLSKSRAGRWAGGLHEKVAERLGRKRFETKHLVGKHGHLQMTAFKAFCEVYELLPEYEWLWASDVFWDEVETVEDAGVCKIYDLTVPETSCFVANDVIVHNTWTAAKIAHYAWAQKNQVLFGTTEISKLRIAMRFVSLHFNLSYRELRMAQLDAVNEQKFKEGLKEVMDSEGLKVIGGDFDFKVESYEAAVSATAEGCEEGKVLALLDGAYLLKVDGGNRIERAANAFDELKRVCKRTGVPNVVTMQFNREVKANVASSVSAEKIALTDVAAWNADLIYGLIQTEDMKADKRMIFKPLKVREGVGEDFEVNWDLDAMNFTELPKVGGASDNDDDPFGTGVPLGDAKGDEVPF